MLHPSYNVIHTDLASKIVALEQQLLADAATFTNQLPPLATSRPGEDDPLTESAARLGPRCGGAPAAGAVRRGRRFLSEPELRELHRPRAKRARSGRPRSRNRSLWAWDDDKAPRPVVWTDDQVAALEDYWTKFIKVNGPWEWFITLTFTYDISLGYALRSARGYLARLRQAARTRAEHQVSFGWVMAVEPTTADRWHLHLLVKASGALVTLSRFRWACRWKGVGSKCGIAKVLLAEKPAAPYLCKYVTKGGQLNAGGDVHRWQDRGPFGKSGERS